MCTAISFLTKDHYFGRNLDLEYHYSETVVVTPRSFPFHFRFQETANSHYAMIGMATISDGYPLYYEATNECGLSMAGLNFPGNAVYHDYNKSAVNIAPFELIPWLLSRYESVAQAKNALQSINLVNMPFSSTFPLSPLHWMVSDKVESIVVEPMDSGIRIYDNPVGVLTNNPPFDYHMYNLRNYLSLTRHEPANRLCSAIDLQPYSRGMGAIGLPGDSSSASRFVRAAFTKLNSVCGDTEPESISQFFHILHSVTQQKGCVMANGKYEKTVYSSCCNTDKGVYYYTTYNNSQISAVDMHRVNLDSAVLASYPLITSQQIRWEN